MVSCSCDREDAGIRVRVIAAHRDARRRPLTPGGRSPPSRPVAASPGAGGDAGRRERQSQAVAHGAVPRGGVRDGVLPLRVLLPGAGLLWGAVGSRACLVGYSTEVECGEHGGVLEREVGDPHSSGVSGAAAQLHGLPLVGTRVLRQHRRCGGRGHPRLHPEAGSRREETGETGTWLIEGPFVKGGTKLDQMAEENQTTWPLGRVSENGCAAGFRSVRARLRACPCLRSSPAAQPATCEGRRQDGGAAASWRTCLLCARR